MASRSTNFVSSLARFFPTGLSVHADRTQQLTTKSRRRRHVKDDVRAAVVGQQRPTKLGGASPDVAVEDVVVLPTHPKLLARHQRRDDRRSRPTPNHVVGGPDGQALRSQLLVVGRHLDDDGSGRHRTELHQSGYGDLKPFFATSQTVYLCMTSLTGGGARI